MVESITTPPSYSDTLTKKYGDIVKSGTAFIQKPRLIVPFSPCLDVILGGGIPEGSFVILTGSPKSGKSLSTLHFCANAQLLNKKIYYLNIEGRLKARDLRGITNLDQSKITLISSEKGNLLTGEKFLQIAEDIIRDEPGSIVVLDSISQLCPEKELEGTIGDTGRNPTALLLASFCRKISNILPVNGNILIGITHQIANTSGFGNPLTESGGRKIAYAVDVKLKAKYFKDWKVGTDGEPIGQTVEWETESTAIIAPGRKTTSYIRYGNGIDEYAEVLFLAENLGKVKKSGAWYKVQTKQGEKIYQGFFNTIEGLKAEPEVYTTLKDEIRQTLVGDIKTL